MPGRRAYSLTRAIPLFRRATPDLTTLVACPVDLVLRVPSPWVADGGHDRVDLVPGTVRAIGHYLKFK